MRWGGGSNVRPLSLRSAPSKSNATPLVFWGIWGGVRLGRGMSRSSRPHTPCGPPRLCALRAATNRAVVESRNPCRRPGGAGGRGTPHAVVDPATDASNIMKRADRRCTRSSSKRWSFVPARDGFCCLRTQTSPPVKSNKRDRSHCAVICSWPEFGGPKWSHWPCSVKANCWISFPRIVGYG